MLKPYKGILEQLMRIIEWEGVNMRKTELQRIRHYKIASQEVLTSQSQDENGSIFANHILEIDKRSTHALSNVTHRHNGIQSLKARVYTVAELSQHTNELVEQLGEPI